MKGRGLKEITKKYEYEDEKIDKWRMIDTEAEIGWRTGHRDRV